MRMILCMRTIRIFGSIKIPQNEWFSYLGGGGGLLSGEH